MGRAEALGEPLAEPGYGVPAGFLEQILPGARYVRILRQDVNRQAVSYWVAYATGIWTDRADDPHGAAPLGEAVYSFEGIERCRRLIENFEVHWDRFLRANGIEPMTVVYERLLEDWEPTIRAVVGHLAPGAGPMAVAPPGTRRQGDDRSEELLERFVRDRERAPLSDPVELVPDLPEPVHGRYRA